MTHELNIEKNNTYDFWKVSCPEDDYITSFKEGDDIKEYYGGKEIYVPGFFTEDDILNTYRCITPEEHASLEKERNESINK